MTTSERTWPVVLQRVEHHVVQVAAESPEEAADFAEAVYGTSPAMGLVLGGYGYSTAASPEVAAEVLRGLQEDGQTIGPLEACPWCQVVTRDAEPDALSLADHGVGCPWHRHEATVLHLDQGQWACTCTCTSTFPIRETEAESTADLRGHYGESANVFGIPRMRLDTRTPEPTRIRAHRLYREDL